VVSSAAILNKSSSLLSNNCVRLLRLQLLYCVVLRNMDKYYVQSVLVVRYQYCILCCIKTMKGAPVLKYLRMCGLVCYHGMPFPRMPLRFYEQVILKKGREKIK
jgi:hypothetical protein